MPPLERQVLDALPITAYAVDLDGRITFTNRSSARVAQSNGTPPLGDADAAIGDSIWDALAEVANRDQIEQAMATLREGRASSVAWELRRGSSDEEHIFLVQVSAIGQGRAVTGFAFSAMDITSSHRWREALVDTGMALSHTISLDRVLAEAALGETRAPRQFSEETIALAEGGTDALRVVHCAGFAGAPEAIASRLAPGWDEALRRGEVVTRPSDDGIELTAPMRGGEGVLGAITLTCALLPAHRIEE